MIEDTRHDPARELDDIEQLVRAHRVRLLRFVTYAIKDREAAVSIVHDCLLKAHASRKAFRNECAVSTWLISIAVNQIKDFQRVKRYQFWRRMSQQSLNVLEDVSFLPSRERSPEQEVLARERAMVVSEAVQQLSGRQRLVFLLRFTEGLEISEIVQATGMTTNTVKTHLQRAVKAVRKQIEAKFS